MNMTRNAKLLAMALGTTMMFSPNAFAKEKQAAQPAAAQPAERQFDLSKEARNAIIELQTAVNAKDAANIPTKLAAAQAVAKTNDDKYVIAKLQTQVAIDAKDDAATARGLQAILASGSATPAEQAKAYVGIGKIAYNAQDFATAKTNLDQAIKLNPNDTDALIMAAETANSAQRTAEAVPMIRKAIALKVAAGQKPPENWYKRNFAFSYNAKLPEMMDVGIEWVKAYPSPSSWRDVLKIFQTNNPDSQQAMDVGRLMYTTNALVSEADYYRLANPLVNRGFPGEAKAVLEQGFTSGKITKGSSNLGPLYTSASAKAAGDQASLAAAGKAALAAPAAGKALGIADAYAGYGDYAKAIELYKAALGKAGADKDLINLRLGMALARSGDKAGAEAALQAAGGSQTWVAKFWLAYLSTLG